MTTTQELRVEAIRIRDSLEADAINLDTMRQAYIDGADFDADYRDDTEGEDVEYDDLDEAIEEFEESLRDRVLEITRTLKQSCHSGGWKTDDVKIDVLICTGGPGYGVVFDEGSNADVWYQDWFTEKTYVTLGVTAAGILRDVWAVDVALMDLEDL